MNQRLDHDRVAEMGRTGIPAPVIAARLRCSLKQVQRILAAHTVEIVPLDLVGTPGEPLLWEHFRSLGDSPARIAYCFGYSRQHISNHFAQPRQIDAMVEDFLNAP